MAKPGDVQSERSQEGVFADQRISAEIRARWRTIEDRLMLSRALLVGMCIALAGCGETNIQAIHRLRPVYETYRSRLEAIVRSLPPVGSVRSTVMPRRMDPAPVFVEDKMNAPEATAEILFLGSPAAEETDSLSIRSPLHSCLAWTGPKNPLHPDVWDNRGGLGTECEAALRRPWLVLYRVVESRLPEELRMEAFVVHVPTERVVAALPVVVHGKLRARDLGAGPWATRARAEVSSAFHQAASCELGIVLDTLPNASFRFAYRPCDGEFRSIAVPGSLETSVAIASTPREEDDLDASLLLDPSFCHPKPEASPGVECVMPEDPTRQQWDALRRARRATIVNLRGLMQRGRACSVDSFAALSSLPRLRSLKDLPVECLPLLLDTARVDQLEQLDLFCGDGTSVDLRGVARLKKLRRLSLGLGCQRGPEGLEPLGALPQLEDLYDVGASLAGLSSLKALKKLAAWTPDVAAIAGAPQLEELWLEAPAGSFDALRSLTLLRSLTVRTNAPGFNPEVLTAMSGLETLDLFACPGITDLKPLASLTSLRTLRLDAARVQDVTPLARLSQLREVSLYGGCSSPSFDLLPLKALSRLESLIIPAGLARQKQSQIAALEAALPSLRIALETGPHHCGPVGW